MRKIVITHNVVDVDTCLKGKPERAAAIGAAHNCRVMNEECPRSPPGS
jgi:hypothetical protein